MDPLRGLFMTVFFHVHRKNSQTGKIHGFSENFDVTLLLVWLLNKLICTSGPSLRIAMAR